MFTVLWLALGLYQCVRTARVCFDGSTLSTLIWPVQFGMLFLPIVVLRRRARAGDGNAPDAPDAVTLILLSYVPVTLALYIAETCARR